MAAKQTKSKMTHDEKVTFARRLTSCLMKLAYAFAFQEQFPPLPWLY